MRDVRRTDVQKIAVSSIKSECMEINGKFKQVSVIVCENSINSISNESLNSSVIKVDLIINGKFT